MVKIPSQKKYSRILFPLLILVVIIAGFIALRSGALKFSASTTKTTPSKDFKIPKSSINPPKDWEILKPDTSTGEIARYESKEIDTEKAEGGSFTTNATIRVKLTNKYNGLEDFFSEYKATGSVNKKFQIIASSPIKINDATGSLLESTFEIEIKSKKILVHQLDYLFFKDGIGFLVEGYSSESSWSKHSTEIKSSLDSFRFL